MRQWTRIRRAGPVRRAIAAVILIAGATGAGSAAAQAPAAAPGLIAVLEFKDRLHGADRDALDRSYLSDHVRNLALQRLRGYRLMSRENMEVLARSRGVDLEKCEGLCEVEIGRKLDADLVLSGDLVRVGSFLKLTLKLHQTQSGELISGAEASGKTADALLGDTDAAVARLLAPLVTVQPSPVAPVRTRAERGAASLGPVAAGRDADAVLVRLESDPPGAVALLDGVLVCQTTPCSKLIAPGAHALSFSKEGFETSVQQMIAAQGTALQARLVKIAATLAVDTSPPGLPVVLDGRAAGRAPLSLAGLQPGPHDLSIDDPCFSREVERVVLQKGEQRELRLEARPRTATAEVSAEDESGNPVEASASVDRRPLGPLPGSFRLPICARSLEVTASGLRSWTAPLQLGEGETRKIRAQLGKPARRRMVVRTHGPAPSIELHPIGGAPLRCASNQCEFDDPQSGTWLVDFDNDDVAVQSRVDVADEGITRVDITSAPGKHAPHAVRNLMIAGAVTTGLTGIVSVSGVLAGADCSQLDGKLECNTAGKVAVYGGLIGGCLAVMFFAWPFFGSDWKLNEPTDFGTASFEVGRGEEKPVSARPPARRVELALGPTSLGIRF